MPIDLKYDFVASNEGGGQVELVINPLSGREDDNHQEPVDLSTNQPERTATVASCYINLVSTCVGAGIIGVPYAFSKAGWILGTILLFLGASFSFVGANLLAECARKIKGPATFYTVAEATIPKYAFLVDIMMAIKCTGVTTSYLFIIGDSLPLVMEEMKAPPFFQNRMVCILLCCFCICMPISLYPKLDHLRFSSWLSGFMLLYLVLLVALYSMHFHSKLLDPCLAYTSSSSHVGIPMTSDGYVCPSTSALNPIQSHSTSGSHTQFSNCKGPQSLFLVTFETLAVLSIFAFNYSCQQNVFTIASEIKNPTMKRLNTVFALTFGTAFLMYIVITYTAYSTFGGNLTPDILAMYPETKLTSACRIMITFILGMHYPLQLNPARKSVLSLTKYFGGYRDDEITPRTASIIYYGVTMSIFAINLIFAAFFTDLGVTYQVCGATGSTLVIFVLPGLFYYLLHSGRVDTIDEVSSEVDDGVVRRDTGVIVEEEEGDDTVNVIHFNAIGSGASQHGLIPATDDSISSRANNSPGRRRTKGPVWKLYMSLIMLVVGVILMPFSTVLIFLQIQQH